MINTRAAGDARQARTGKDGAFYNRATEADWA